MMAVESKYWKEELRRIVISIRPVSKPKRWSERAVCTAERDVMVGCFIVRRLLELQKLSTRVAGLRLRVFCAPTTKSVNKLNRYSIDENYDWRTEIVGEKSVVYVCNQCIHAYISVILRGPDRNWSDLLVVSDFDRNDVIWRIPFSTLVDLFVAASIDPSPSYQMIYNSVSGDYDVRLK